MVQAIIPEMVRSIGSAPVSLEATTLPADERFETALENMITEVDREQKEADQSLKRLSLLQEGPTLHELVGKLEEADLAFEKMKGIRDKLRRTYAEVMRMNQR